MRAIHRGEMRPAPTRAVVRRPALRFGAMPPGAMPFLAIPHGTRVCEVVR